MADIFISYKSERRAAAEHLAEILADTGYSVWWDYALVSGNDFGAQIEREIRAAKAVIVLWCSLARESEWVKEEASLAKRLGKIIPARIEMIDLPLGFSMAHTLDLMDWDGSPHGRELEQLVHEIARLVGRKPKPNQDGLNRTERAWRRYGAPALRDFALIDDLERKRPARTLPSALRQPPQETKVAEETPHRFSNEPAQRRPDQSGESSSDWRSMLPKNPAAWLRAIPRNRSAIALYAFVLVLLAWTVYRNLTAEQPVRPGDTAPTQASIAPPATSTAAPEHTTPPAHPATPRPSDPTTTTTTPTQVGWKICNESSHGDLYVAIAYVADSDAGSDLWTHDGWWKVAQGQCALIKRTMSKTLLVRAETSDGATVWDGDKKFCLLPAKFSNYMVPVQAGAACPRGYEAAKAFRRDAGEYGVYLINLRD